MKEETDTGPSEPTPGTRLLMNLGRLAIWLGVAALVAAILAPPHLRLIAIAAGATAAVAGAVIACRNMDLMLGPEQEPEPGSPPSRTAPQMGRPRRSRRRIRRKEENDGRNVGDEQHQPGAGQARE